MIRPCRLVDTRHSLSQAGFTVLELMLMVAILAIIASIIQPAVGTVLAKARDARRAADADAIVQAIHHYQIDHNGQLPPMTPGAAGVGFWEVSYKPGFLSSLSSYLSRVPVDPLNRWKEEADFNWNGRDGTYFYSYFLYPDWATQAECGTPMVDFAVVSVRAFETGRKPGMPKAVCGDDVPGGCPGKIPFVCRDWSPEWDYSVLIEAKQ